MAIIAPFRAWRYNPERVPVQRAVTQPYDKITPAMQEAYYQSSPYNLVRIILGKRLPDDTEAENVYTRAAASFQNWRQTAVLRQDTEPSIYRYSQTFKLPGSQTQAERRGFIALGRIENYSANVIFRHEQTLAKPKADRMDLLRATRAHFGQIFMLYAGAGKVDAMLDSAAAPDISPNISPEIEVTDEYGVLHRVWRIADRAAISAVQAAMRDQKLIIADGHHRYETALNYSKEHAVGAPAKAEYGVNNLPQPAYPEAAVMMTFVNMDSDGLVILPTHRVVHSLPGFDPAAFAVAAEEFFTVVPLLAAEAAGYIELLGKQEGTAFVAVTGSGAFLLRSKPEAVAAALADLPERQRNLDLSHLHSIILDRLLGLDEEKVREQTNLRYLRDAGEAVDLVRRGEANVAFLTNPVSMEQLREVAFAGDVMPQKSTDFFPKLLSGLAIYALD